MSRGGVLERPYGGWIPYQIVGAWLTWEALDYFGNGAKRSNHLSYSIHPTSLCFRFCDKLITNFDTSNHKL
jgi:hypothetical protein